MKNITVSVPDEVYRSARVRAAERGTSVSAMVAEYLESMTLRRAECIRREQLQDRILSEIETFTASDRLEREAVHNRAIR